MSIYNINCQKHLCFLISKLLHKIKKYKYHIFIANIGEGKTTIIRNILYLLGVDKTRVTSPTFNYLKIIPCNLGCAVHIDLYRIDTINQCIEILQSAKEENPDIYFIEHGEKIIETNFYKTIRKQTLLWNIKTVDGEKKLNLDKI